MTFFDDITGNKNLLDAFKDSFGQYVVTPISAFGIGGFVFDVEGDTTHSLGAEITDHYTEANYAVQDHIAIKPKKITLKNYVGELVYRPNGDGNTTLQKVARKLTVLGSYLPALSNGGKQVQSLLTETQDSISFNTALNSAVNVYSIFKNLNPPIPRQQQAYQYFKALMEQKVLVSVQTPFEYASNMAIESIVATQPEGSKFISDFAITLKEIRLAKTKTKDFSYTVPLDPTNAAQTADQVNAGKTQGVSKPVDSILSKWLNL